jgi:hypothetical protein
MGPIFFKPVAYTLEVLKMRGSTVAVIYLVVMVVVIFALDFAFFRNRFWERLIANIGVVLLFVAFYWRFFRQP